MKEVSYREAYNPTKKETYIYSIYNFITGISRGGVMPLFFTSSRLYASKLYTPL